ncbi:MAG: hypothetical protein M0R77_02755 [Gammaproteobacteria bacterium]|nr:hypothetical protein [Gammaproteobacteria bacterium]
MNVKLNFYIFRKEIVGGPYQSIAICSPDGKQYSMKELNHIVETYTVKCEPNFTSDERPMVSHFELEFEEHMYTAFMIAET